MVLADIIWYLSLTYFQYGLRIISMSMPAQRQYGYRCLEILKS